MKQRGRQSSAALSTVTNTVLWEAKAPDYLSAEQKEVWQTCVHRLGHDWFPAEVLPLLEQYTTAVVITRSLTRQLNNTDLSPGERRKTEGAWHTYTHMMLTLAVKLRIPTQSIRKQKPKVYAKRPWEAEAESD